MDERTSVDRRVQDNEQPSADPLAAQIDEPSPERPESSVAAVGGAAGEKRSIEELITILRQKKQVDFNDELMDPIEWTVRKVCPLPAVYYWDLLEGQPEEIKKEIPWKIRWWHRIVGSLDRASNVVDRWVAQPVAGTLGLTESRFEYVIDSMTEEELEASKRNVAERKQQLGQEQRLEGGGDIG
ncbi:hypothetical protein ACA910_005048 [Epithemia clementina (nom. ined.)]